MSKQTEMKSKVDSWEKHRNEFLAKAKVIKVPKSQVNQVKMPGDKK